MCTLTFWKLYTQLLGREAALHVCGEGVVSNIREWTAQVTAQISPFIRVSYLTHMQCSPGEGVAIPVARGPMAY